MDFMKILLTYMATTLLVAVESTATPSVTPVPTPGPEETPVYAVITEVPAELTAEPTISVTPVPVPTISPNPKYHNLAQGDRGDDVRALQERLIELGYLPEGAADGAYGGQTRNAVRRFQYYNSLQVDGIAGRATQTNMFENPDVMPYPGQATETPPAEETPGAVLTPEPEAETEMPAEATGAAEPVPTQEPEKVTEVPKEDVSQAPEVTDTPKPETATESPETETASAPEATDTSVPETAAETPETETGKAPEATNTPEPEAATEAPAAESATPEITATPKPETTTDAPKENISPVPETADTPEPGAETDNPAAESAESPRVSAEPAATPQPTEIVENVDLDDEYEELAGWIVLNESGAAMQWNALQDGVTVIRFPRMQIREELIRISLDDVAQCMESWTLTDDGDTVVLEAEGYTLGLFNEDAGFAATVDGMEISTDSQDFDFIRDGHFISVDFLTRALNGSWEWDAEEWTLMLRIPGKSTLNATD